MSSADAAHEWRPATRRHALHQMCRRMSRTRVLDVAPRLTLLLLVLYSGRYWDLNIPIALCAALGMCSPHLIRCTWYWTTIGAVLMFGNLGRVYVVDNHKLLMSYWCVAISLCLARRSERALGVNARVLIGLCFSFAVLWKTLSPDYLNGAFFHYTLLVDGRFTRFASIVAGISPTVLASNVVELRALQPSVNALANLESTESVALLSKIVTWWGYSLELAIAVAFLAPLDGLYRLRNPLLLTFLVTTYVVAPVIGFGWLLCIMGFAQCGCREVSARVCYIACFLLLQLFLLPWATLLGVAYRAY